MDQTLLKDHTLEKVSLASAPEMNGPSDIGDILSGLKTKNIDINSTTQKDSKISIEELKEIGGSKPPGKPRKKPKSEKNTVALHL